MSAIRWNPKAVLIPSVVVATIVGVVNAVVTFFVGRDLHNGITISQSGGTLSSSQASQFGFAEVTLGGATLVLSLLSGAILATVMATVIGHAVLGRKETPGSSWRATSSRLGPAIAARVLTILFVGGGWAVAVGISAGAGALLGAGAHLVPLGVLVGVIGGLTATVFAAMVWIRWQLVVPVAVLERAGPLKSMGRSWRLVRGSWWRVLGILILTDLIVGLMTLLIRVPFAIGGGGLGIFTGQSSSGSTSVMAVALAAVGGIIAGTLLAPLSAGVTALMYADLRMRREGMDITLQASATAGGQFPDVQFPASPRPSTPAPGSPGSTQNPGAQSPGTQPSGGPEPGAW
ncbi:MAG TPA: glycerophosphoryl diester phosphodiesterase membrane domain-containing protein [Trebonia sp.]